MMSDGERDELIRAKAQLAERLYAKDAITQEAFDRERSAAAVESAAAGASAVTIKLDEEQPATPS